MQLLDPGMWSCFSYYIIAIFTHIILNILSFIDIIMVCNEGTLNDFLFLIYEKLMIIKIVMQLLIHMKNLTMPSVAA